MVEAPFRCLEIRRSVAADAIDKAIAAVLFRDIRRANEVEIQRRLRAAAAIARARESDRLGL